MKKKVNRVKYKTKEKRNKNKKSTKKEKERNKNPNKKNIPGHRCTLGTMAEGSAHFFSSSSFLKGAGQQHTEIRGESDGDADHVASRPRPTPPVRQVHQGYGSTSRVTAINQSPSSGRLRTRTDDGTIVTDSVRRQPVNRSALCWTNRRLRTCS